jgi:hypothetical protein
VGCALHEEALEDDVEIELDFGWHEEVGCHLYSTCFERVTRKIRSITNGGT